jgi:hypothetical protein
MAEEKFYTIAEAVETFKIPVRTLKRYIKDGKIKSIIEKHIRLIPEEELIKVSSLKNRKVSSYSGESANSDRESANFDGESANSDRESANFDGESANSDRESANFDGESANSDRETDKVDKSILRWAKEYVYKFGYSVIPVGRDKKPIIDWKEYQTRYPTDEELEAWFSDGKNNIAIVTGPISEIAVLDIDGEEGEESIKQNRLYLPPTPCVKTGKGYHYYFKYQDGVRNFTKRYPGIDLRGEGGYVLAPPSIHPSGMRYEWLIPLDSNLSELPEWVLKEKKEIKEKEPGWVEKLLEGVEEGQRNDTLARLAGHYFGKKLSLEETKKILLDWNKRNRPPLDETELTRTVESIYKTDIRNKPIEKEDIEEEPEEKIDLDLLTEEEKEKERDIKLPFINKYIEIASERTDAPKDYHLGSALAILSAVIGPNISSPIMTGLTRPLKCNLYILLLGESSLYRKSTAVYFATACLKKIPDYLGSPSENLKDQRYGLLIPQNFSPEALFYILSKRNSKASFLLKDEVSGLLRAFKKPYMAGTKEDLIKAYDGDRIEQMTLGRGYLVIDEPYLTWLSATTPENFSAVFEESDIASGLLPRFLIVYPEAHGRGKKLEYISDGFKDDPELIALQEDIKKIYDYWTSYEGLYYLSDWGLERLNKLVEKLETAIDKDPNLDKTLARLPWTVYKLAMILQATEDGLQGIKKGKMSIKDEYLLASIGIINKFLPQTLKALEIVGQSAINKTIQKIEIYLRGSTKKMRKKSEIMNKFRLTADFMEDIKRTMLDRDQIEILEGQKGGEFWKLK